MSFDQFIPSLEISSENTSPPLADISIVVKSSVDSSEIKFRSHKIILSAYSTYFKDLFLKPKTEKTEDGNSKPENVETLSIDFKLSPDAMNLILSTIYSSSPVSYLSAADVDTLTSCLLFISKFSFPTSLVSLISSSLDSKIRESSTTAASFLTSLSTQNPPEMLANLIDFAESVLIHDPNICKVVADAHMPITSASLLRFLSSDLLEISEEEEIFDLVTLLLKEDATKGKDSKYSLVIKPTQFTLSSSEGLGELGEANWVIFLENENDKKKSENFSSMDFSKTNITLEIPNLANSRTLLRLAKQKENDPQEETVLTWKIDEKLLTSEQGEIKLASEENNQKKGGFLTVNYSKQIINDGKKIEDKEEDVRHKLIRSIRWKLLNHETLLKATKMDEFKGLAESLIIEAFSSKLDVYEGKHEAMDKPRKGPAKPLQGDKEDEELTVVAEEETEKLALCNPTHSPSLSSSHSSSGDSRTHNTIYLRHKSGFDQSGLFFFLGSKGGSVLWRNPLSLCKIRPISSGIGYGTIDTLFSRTNNHLRTENVPESFLGVELIDGSKFILEGYCLRNRSGSSSHCLINWDMEGSIGGDVDEWTLLDSRKNDKSLMQPSAAEFFETSNRLASNAAFNKFRIIQKGTNSSGGHNLVISNLELYGVLRTTDA